MANSVQVLKLSGSTDGKQIKVAANSSPGTTIHTATSTSGEYDRVFLWAYNSNTSDVILTIEWGGTTSDDRYSQLIEFQKGLIYVVPGNVIANGLLVKAYAATADVIYLSGYVYRVTPGA